MRTILKEIQVTTRVDQYITFAITLSTGFPMKELQEEAEQFKSSISIELLKENDESCIVRCTYLPDLIRLGIVIENIRNTHRKPHI